MCCGITTLACSIRTSAPGRGPSVSSGVVLNGGSSSGCCAAYDPPRAGGELKERREERRGKLEISKTQHACERATDILSSTAGVYLVPEDTATLW